MSGPLRIARASASLHLHRLKVPVLSSFGAMRARPMLLVRIEDKDGACGWGEIWCNFPPGGGETRKRHFDELFVPMLEGATFDGPAEAYAEIGRRTRIMAIQAGEPGPFAQVLAGIDQALWDLSARRAKQPLWKHLGGASGEVAVYASGMGPDTAVALKQAKASVAAGYEAFKLKVGFAHESDLAALGALRVELGPDAFIAIDANQAWDVETASRRVREFAKFRPAWIEEPLAADATEAEWQLVAGLSASKIAAGENMRGAAQFRHAIESNAFGVIQPDLAKWGGFTGCLAVARQTIEAGLMFCPHYLGGAVGLAASAHLLAAAGGEGKLEIDAQDNPLRTEALGDFPRVSKGRLRLPDRPGLGYDPDPDFLKRTLEAA
ncbi:MAG: mandelate racemase/muconate lactonizing enzyme family protein [Alphaproteobacteria bacterium]|nr:mandelate racemase/muconate lactonizing enzyme family protein [Alphaproteobacteria bacterium]